MTDRIEIKVPDIGDFSDIPVIELLVAEGDRVDAEDSLITLESDKATMEVPSPSAGVIRALKVKVDDTVSEGDVVAILEVESDAAGDSEDTGAAGDADEGGEAEKSSAEEPPAEEPPAKEPPAGEEAAIEEKAEPDAAPTAAGEERPTGAAAVDPSNVPYASPAVRLYARELGADLGRVTGSGSKGRITRDDVTAFVKQVMTSPAAAPASAGGRIGGLDLDFPELQMPDFSRFGDVERQALTRIQKISAAHLHRNWVGIPHVTQHDEADITDMESFRQANIEDAKAQGFKLTPLVFLIKAMVAALKKFPRFNASLDSDGETLIVKKYYNVGVAVDTPDGLVVPVIRDCDRKGIMELAAELAEVSARAREQKLKPADIQGGCISISSLGGIGGTAFTPIINAPEVAILGVSRSQMKPVWDGENFQPRLMLPLSLSYDHRVIDGAAAARFVRFLGSRLEDLRRLTL
ncbi:MAG: dihydrolipoyllysine-residue acetyltransferase [Xanthomonadales bacterium]